MEGKRKKEEGKEGKEEKQEKKEKSKGQKEGGQKPRRENEGKFVIYTIYETFKDLLKIKRRGPEQLHSR